MGTEFSKAVRRVAADNPAYTYKQIADKVGCSVSTVSKHLANRQPPAPVSRGGVPAAAPNGSTRERRRLFGSRPRCPDPDAHIVGVGVFGGSTLSVPPRRCPDPSAHT